MRLAHLGHATMGKDLTDLAHAYDTSVLGNDLVQQGRLRRGIA